MSENNHPQPTPAQKGKKDGEGEGAEMEARCMRDSGYTTSGAVVPEADVGLAWRWPDSDGSVDEVWGAGSRGYSIHASPTQNHASTQLQPRAGVAGAPPGPDCCLHIALQHRT